MAHPSYEIRIDPRPALGKLQKLPDSIKAALYAEASELAKKLLDRMIAKASGEVVQVRSGKYLGSFKSKVTQTSSGISARVFTSDPIANILEHGAHIPPHLITAKNVKALHFLDAKGAAFGFSPTAGDVFAAVVHSPGGTVEPHSVVYSTFEEEEGEIIDRLDEVTEKATKDAGVE